MIPVGFIGDELTAAGFRLAGAHTETPDASQFPHAYARLRGECELLILTEPFASLLEPGQRARDQAALEPLMLVIGDAAGGQRPEDIAAQVRRHLGIREDEDG